MLALIMVSCEGAGGYNSSHALVGQWITPIETEDDNLLLEVKEGESTTFLIYTFDKKYLTTKYLYGTYRDGILANAYEDEWCRELNSMSSGISSPYTYSNGHLENGAISVQIYWVNKDHFYFTAFGVTAHLLRIKEIRYAY